MSTPIVEWVRQNATMNTINSDSYPSIATDINRNIYIAYTTFGTTSGQTTTGSSDIVVIKMNTSGTVLWVRQNSIMNTNQAENKPTIAVDINSNVFVTYYTGGTSSGQQNIGSTDIVVFKMNTLGTVEWIRQNPIINTPQADSYPIISTDNNGNVFVTYYTLGTSSGQQNIGSADIVVFKMNTLGTVEWIRQNAIINTSTSDTYPSIVTDMNGNIFVSYITLGTSSGQQNIGGQDIVVFKMNTLGTVEWVRQNAIINTITSDVDPSIATDNNGNIFVSYSTLGTSSGQQNIGGQDIVVFKMNTLGTVEWVRQNAIINTSTTDFDPSIATDNNGNVFVTYYTIGTSSGQQNIGSLDIVVFKMNTMGTVEWVLQNPIINTVQGDFSSQIASDIDGDVYVTYYTTGTSSGQQNIGSTDIVVFKIHQITIKPSAPIDRTQTYWPSPSERTDAKKLCLCGSPIKNFDEYMRYKRSKLVGCCCNATPCTPANMYPSS